MDDEGLNHMIRILGLCQTPRDSWSDEDNRALREARQYVQDNRKDLSESKRKKTGSGDAGNSSQGQGVPPTEEGVSEEGVLVEEGNEGASDPED